jgi:hypothetical protein
MLAGAAAAAAHDESHEFPTYGTLEHERMVRDSQTASPTRVVVHELVSSLVFHHACKKSNSK